MEKGRVKVIRKVVLVGALSVIGGFVIRLIRPHDGDSSLLVIEAYFLIAIGVLLSLLGFIGLPMYHGHATWFFESRWGPGGNQTQQPNAYQSLYEWAAHATRTGIHAQQFSVFASAAFFIILGFVLCAWARDRARLLELTDATRPKQNA